MDKETLSNYGWIVICVLVLAVMLALATPFGTFVADGFKATYTGLFQTGDNAMDTALGAVGVSNNLPCGHGRKEAGDHSQKGCGHYNCQDTDCGCVPASCGVEGHWSGDGMDHTTKVNHTGHTYACQCSGWVVPEGGTYKLSNGTVYNSGEQLPCGYGSKNGDIYVYGDYEYCYNYRANTNWQYNSQNGWGVKVLDKTKTEYGPILETINGKMITNMAGTFYQCANLISIPEIPNSVTEMLRTFAECTALTDVSNLIIPNSVTEIQYIFYNCTSLTDLSDFAIPDSVKEMNFAFGGCTSLEAAHAIPSSVVYMRNAFIRCTSLVVAPDMSKATGVSDIFGAFENCTSLTGTLEIHCHLTPEHWSYCPVTVTYFHATDCDGSCGK